MKSLIVLATLLLSTQSFAEQIRCRAESAVQHEQTMKADAEISFELNIEEKTISKVIGHIFVQGAYVEHDQITVEDSYMGFFQFDSLASNSNYRPYKYKGYTQFKDFDAVHTSGQEDGMWGSFVVDLNSTEKKFDARYIFQAGDHMGGTVLFTCRR